MYYNQILYILSQAFGYISYATVTICITIISELCFFLYVFYHTCHNIYIFEDVFITTVSLT